VVRVRRGRGIGLRRQALNISADHAHGADGDWDLVELGYLDPARLADQVLPYGADVVVVDPPEAVEAVTHRLHALVSAP
jgi:predicted DNA-binding transcriptional regulator YafY